MRSVCLFQSPCYEAGVILPFHRAFLVAQVVNNPSAMQKTRVWSLGWENPLEKGTASHSSILAWRIPWTKSRTQLSNFHFHLLSIRRKIGKIHYTLCILKISLSFLSPTFILVGWTDVISKLLCRYRLSQEGESLKFKCLFFFNDNKVVNSLIYFFNFILFLNFT